jgi:hypothetical protein
VLLTLVLLVRVLGVDAPVGGDREKRGFKLPNTLLKVAELVTEAWQTSASVAHVNWRLHPCFVSL